MKIGIKANELIDGKIEFVSLVKHGVNRSPFKIIKAEDQKPAWLAQMPELAKLKQRFDSLVSVTKETKTVKMKDAIAGMVGSPEPVQKTDAEKVRKLAIAKLRHKLAGLYSQQQDLWERPNAPAFEKFDDELTFSIEKAESELRLLVSDEDQMHASSAFFRRGGQSHVLQADLNDSAYGRRSAVSKAAERLDLSPINTQSDFNRINKADAEVDIDLSSLKF